MAWWPCPLCKQKITGAHTKAAHYKNLWKAVDDANRCDNLVGTQVPIILQPSWDGDPGDAHDSGAATATACAVVNEPATACGIYDLARRPAKDLATARGERAQYTIASLSERNPIRSGTYNVLKNQNDWDRYLCIFHTCACMFD